jgi:tetratricopeptide (TPR) repeat protein
MSKMTRYILLAITLIGALLFFYFNNRGLESNNADFDSFSALKLPKLKSTQGNQVEEKKTLDFSSKTSADDMVEDLSSTVVDPKCQEMAVNIHDTPLEKLVTGYDSYFQNGTCLAKDQKKVDQLKKLLDKLCNDKDEKTAAFSKMGCQNILLSMKQKLMELYTSGASVGALDDNSLNYEFIRLVKLLNDPNSMAENIGRMKEVSEEMYKRKPYDVPAVQSLVLSQLYTSEGTPSEESYQENLSRLNKAKEKNPDQARAIEETKTILNLKQGNYDQVVDDADKRLAVNDKDITALYDKSAALYRKGEKAAAIEHIDKILKIVPNHPFYAQIKKDVEKADPNNPDEKPFRKNVTFPLPVQ